ncbi:MAG TPA: prepilin-type N-terminal cleavage/methylation domain-containing protein [Prosthecobacter sp.]|nr:prepilin-type N-terminal cleavage/methylation domain-containing protein [Prosthecobacter sp.]
MKTNSPALRHPGGFTLLEMIVALAAFVLLIGGIFAITRGTVELSNDVSIAQDRSLLRQNFIEFVRRSFRTLPGGAEVRLTVRQKGSTYVPTINVVNGGSSFTPGGSLAPDTSVELYAEERPGGYLRVAVRVLDVKQTSAFRAGQPMRYSKNEPTVPLLDNVSRFEWRFYDAATNRWENNWKDARRPLLAEMSLRLDDGFEARSVFWVPPVVPNGLGGAGFGGGAGGPGTGGPGTGGPGTGGPGGGDQNNSSGNP